MKAVHSRPAAHECLLAIVLLLATVALLYGHTLHVPMYLDDHGALLENHRLRDLSATLQSLFDQRGLTNLTFALNFRLTSWSLPSLHLTNIALHLLCSFLVWILLRQLLPRRGLALLGALFFVAHPLQTQPVTYLVQRSAVLAGVFFFAAVLSHRLARSILAAGGTRMSRKYLAWHVGAVALGGAAILAKEHTVILPLLLFVHDRFFPVPFVRSLRQTVLDYLPYIAISLLVGSAVLLSLLETTEISHLRAMLSSQRNAAPLYYLVTQFSVLWVYLRLLLMPYGQALEHDYPLATELLNLQNAGALVGLLGAGWLIWQLRRRHPLLAFGAVWFVLGLVVESSLIPLDPLFEHRLYLPMFGFLLALLDIVPAVCGERRGLIFLSIALTLLMPLTWRRNALWKDPLSFNEQNLTVAPQSTNVQLALLYNYRDVGRLSEAERSARALLHANPLSAKAYQELALLQARQGDARQAISTLEDGLLHLPRDPGLYKTAGQILFQGGDSSAALAFLRRGIASDPQNPTMHDQLAALLFELGDVAAAETQYRQNLASAGGSAARHRNFAKVLYSQNRMAEAISHLRIALELEPGNPDIWEGLGMSALAIGDTFTARRAMEKLERIDSEAASRLRANLAAAGNLEARNR